MEIRKEIMRSGKHVYLDQDGKPAILDATPAKIKHYSDNGNAMLAAGLPIPVPLEHDPSVSAANPKITLADIAANRVVNNAGHVKKFETEVFKNKAGEDVHRLVSVLDITNPMAGEQIKNKSIKWVSPWINTFTDGKGKEWNEVVSHVALTTRPRIHEQSPFESVSMALSIATIAPKSPPLGLAISRAGELKADGKPKFPIAFSLMTGVKLSKEDLEEIDDEEEQDADDPDAQGADGADPVASDPMASELAKDDAMAGADESAGDVSFEELIPHLLELHGIHVPAGGKGKEFLQALVRGLLTSAKSMAANDGGTDDTVLGDDPTNPKPSDKTQAKGPVIQESPPMYMSLEEIKKIKDPKEKAMAQQIFSLQQTVGAVAKNQIANAAKERAAKLERICKRLPLIERDKLLKMFASPGAQLSLDQHTGVVVDPMAETLDLYASLTKRLDQLEAQREGIKLSTEEEHPQDGGSVSDQRAQEIADNQTKRSRPREPVGDNLNGQNRLN